MPTPKYTPGSRIIPLTFANPAFQGLNTEVGGNILPQQWATVLENAVFDETGRPASRKGWTTLTTTPAATGIKTVFEHWEADQTSSIIQATDTDIYEDVSTPASIKGTLTITDGNIKFTNFYDKCIAFGIGTGGIPVVRTTGNFADIVVSDGGTAPTGKVGTSAFGRLWCADADGLILRYSALLDETAWAVASGGGTIDLSKTWPDGQDTIVAVQEFGADLVVFGKNNTVIMTDGAGSSLGIDPTQLYVSDTLPGVGAVSQFAICRAAGDLWVLTDFGVVGLRRELVQKSTPFNNISANVQSGITGALQATTNKDTIRMVYSPIHSMVVCHFPAVDTSYVFDTRVRLEDGTYRCSTWLSNLTALAYVRSAEALYGTLSNVTGEVFKYSGNSDDGTAFIFDYESGWLDLGEEMNLYLKFVKRMTTFVFITQNVEVTHKVLYDFQTNSYSLAKAATGTTRNEYNAFGAVVSGSTQAEYAAFGAAESVEYGGGVTLRTIDAPLGGGGQFIKVGLRLSTEAGEFILQQINLFAKVGRIAT